MSTDHLEPRPVTRARSSTASSDFLLLTTEHESTPLLSPSPSSSIPLSPPRFRPLLQLAAVLDLVCVLGYGSTVPLTKLPLSAVSLNSLRPFVVIYAVTSVKVRENAPVLLGQLIVSSLILLYRLNELVQTTSSTSPPPSLLPYLPSRFSNPISTWYLTSFLFSLLHYILYILFVGIRKRRNPFIGSAGTMRRNRSANNGKVRRTLRRNTWTEETWEGRQEWVSSRRSVGSDEEEEERLGRDGDRGFEEEEEGRPGQEGQGETESNNSSLEEDSISDLSSSTSSSDEEEEDEHELIDIPKPGHTLHGTNMLRNRSSRTSLLSLPLSEPSTSGRGNVLKASRGYGSMRSLSGI